MIAGWDDLTFGWLVGLLEGEGCFSAPPPSEPNKPRIQIQMMDEDVVARVASLWGTKYGRNYPKHYRDQGWSPIFYVQLKGRRAVEWMKLLRPYMSKRRQEQIDAALPPFNPHLREEKCRIGFLAAGEIRRRKASGEPASAIAKSLGISLSYVHKICNGTRRAEPV